MITSPSNASPTEPKKSPPKARGYWGDVWVRFRAKPLPLSALCYVILMSFLALFAPLIVGTKPIVCQFKGKYYFPCLAYYNETWENPIFTKELKKKYNAMAKKDPQSWAIWPLIYQDPMRRIRGAEFPNVPENKNASEGGNPSLQNFFGTDQGGVDVFAQIIHGTQTALLVGFFSMGIATIIGLTLGALAGYLGGVVDSFLSRLTEIMLCIPSLVLIIATISIVEKPTIWHTMFVLGITGWTSISRLARAEFLKLRNAEYVVAARALGASQLRVMFRHILPNAMAPVLVPITFGIASAILTENALQFLGIGNAPSTASWGKLLNAGQQTPEIWWLIFFPGGAIFLTVLAYNLIGEGLQEATDPRLREGTK